MRYAELRPDQLASAFEASPVAIWPIGALEWHGPHLPLGLDGIVAEAFAARLQERVGGVVLPCLWHPITTLPHPMSLDVSTDTFRNLIRSTVHGLGRAGARVVCLITGHYAQGHSIELFKLAQDVLSPPSSRFLGMREGLGEGDSPVIVTASPLEPLENEDLLDHAGAWETAQLMNPRPDLIDLNTLPEHLNPKHHAVLGSDPRLAEPEKAKKYEEQALRVWESWVQDALRRETDELQRFYERRLSAYSPYVAKFYLTSWEQAIEDWWAGKD